MATSISEAQAELIKYVWGSISKSMDHLSDGDTILTAALSSLAPDDIPHKLRCANCSKLAVNALRLPCCEQAICETCTSHALDERSVGPSSNRTKATRTSPSRAPSASTLRYPRPTVTLTSPCGPPSGYSCVRRRRSEKPLGQKKPTIPRPPRRLMRRSRRCPTPMSLLRWKGRQRRRQTPVKKCLCKNRRRGALTNRPLATSRISRFDLPNSLLLLIVTMLTCPVPDSRTQH